MEDGRWKVKDGRWRMEGGRWSIEEDWEETELLLPPWEPCLNSCRQGRNGVNLQREVQVSFPTASQHLLHTMPGIQAAPSLRSTSFCSTSGLDLAPVHSRGAQDKQGSEPPDLWAGLWHPSPQLCLPAAQPAFLLW